MRFPFLFRGLGMMVVDNINGACGVASRAINERVGVWAWAYDVRLGLGLLAVWAWACAVRLGLGLLAGFWAC